MNSRRAFPFAYFEGSTSVRENVMKVLISTLAVALALAFTGPAFAGDVTNATDKASCDKAGGTWDDAAKKCSEKKM
jgi:hypothetical protein